MGGKVQAIRLVVAISTMAFGLIGSTQRDDVKSWIFADSAHAQGAAPEGDTPGGGYGCQSRGTCKGTLYNDKSNLESWWYPICSGCHTVQAPPPPNTQAALSPNQRKLVADYKAFWALHQQAKPDPVLRRLAPRQTLKPIGLIAPEFQALMKK
jgi:hypothetical protein